MLKSFGWKSLIGALLICASSVQAGDWLIGSGKYDVTGPAADAGMVGYGEVGQTTKGIHSRLWSRAYVIAHPSTGKRLVFVSADLMSIPQGVKQGVMKKLISRYGSTYSDANVMLTATHTHVGPGGFDHYVMLNMSALGYDSKNYNAIIDGIYQSIVRANDSMSSGNIHIKNGTLLNTSINRNPVPYSQNPDANDYTHNTNKRMTLLKLVKDNGTEIGSINWFGVHNVSMGTDYRQISGDNKGAASQMLEEWSADRGQSSMVAAFANSALGDSSPNICGPENGCGANDEQSVLISADKQYSQAKSLYESATTKLSGTLDYRHQYVYFPGYQVTDQFTGSGTQSICEGAIGWSMTAGATWDGPSGIAGVFEGMTVNNDGTSWHRSRSFFENVLEGFPLFALMNGFSSLTMWNEAVDDPCQYPKPTFVNRKTLGAELYTAHLPFQLFRIGSLALIAAPGEMTTMASRRLRNEVRSVLESQGVDTFVIAGLANAYQGYITTPEEYNMQHYEGGHTLYGPNTLAAYKQVYNQLATALKNGTSVSAGPTPPDLLNDQIIPVLGVVYDDKRLWESFGQVWNNANSSYSKGSTVKVKFRAGHPRNNLKTMSSFLEVQKKVGTSWQTVFTDDDLNTRFIWIRDTAFDCLACSFSEIKWITDSSTASGTYRIRHKGHWKSGWDGKIRSYTGTSRTFLIY